MKHTGSLLQLVMSRFRLDAGVLAEQAVIAANEAGAHFRGLAEQLLLVSLVLLATLDSEQASSLKKQISEENKTNTCISKNEQG